MVEGTAGRSKPFGSASHQSELVAPIVAPQRVIWFDTEMTGFWNWSPKSSSEW